MGLPPNVVGGDLGIPDASPGLASVVSAPVTVCTVPTNDISICLRTLSAKVLIGPRVGVVGLGSLATEVVVVEPLVSVSAVAIAPPELPIIRAVESTQTLAAVRRCVEMVISSPLASGPVSR